MSQFTKAAIITSFYKLLERKSFEKITVKDIVEDCGVNRKTFYYYFSDIYDLIEQLFTLEINGFVESSAKELTLEESFVGVLELIEKHKRAVYHLYASSSRSELEKYLFKALSNMIIKKIKTLGAGRKVRDEDLRLMCEVFVSAFLGVVYRWIDEGMKPDFRRKIDRMRVMLKGATNFTFDNLEKSGDGR